MVLFTATQDFVPPDELPPEELPKMLLLSDRQMRRAQNRSRDCDGVLRLSRSRHHYGTGRGRHILSDARIDRAQETEIRSSL